MRDYKAELCCYIDENWNIAKMDREYFLNKIYSSHNILLFGSGEVGKAVAYEIADIGLKVNFFCDNNEKLWNKEILDSIRCISINELQKYKENSIILIATGYYKEVCEQLKSLGINNYFVVHKQMISNYIYWNKVSENYLKNKLLELMDILKDEKSKKIVYTILKSWLDKLEYPDIFNEIYTDDQYFPEHIIKLLDKEIFLDAGAYDGDTIKEFLIRTDKKFEKIIAYELDKNCFIKLKENFNTLDNNLMNKIDLYRLGVFDENKKIKYNANSASSAISSTANEEGEVVKISDHLENRKVTFIKMDIEGAELNALIGAKSIIQEHKPKLAICIYHKPSHLWEIPLYLKSILPEYKIYIRHHSSLEFETVCYAVL